MKVKCLTRPISAHQTPGSNVAKLPKNTAPEAHPFERAREYARALNAVKLERMFAAPFVCQLGVGHSDGVYEIATHPSSLSKFASEPFDVWDGRYETVRGPGNKRRCAGGYVAGVLHELVPPPVEECLCGIGLGCYQDLRPRTAQCHPRCSPLANVDRHHHACLLQSGGTIHPGVYFHGQRGSDLRHTDLIPSHQGESEPFSLFGP